MDILDTNPYSGGTNTYGVQKNIQEFHEKEKIRARTQRIVLDPMLVVETAATAETGAGGAVSNSDRSRIIGVGNDVNQIPLLDSDPINTNKIDFNAYIPENPAPRIVKEKIRLLSVSSKHREKWESRELSVDPITKKYTRLVTDDEGNNLVCRYTADQLNAEYYWGLYNVETDEPIDIAEPFYEKDGRIFCKISKYPSPNHYVINLIRPLSYVKAIGLVACEVPNPYQTIGSHNNIIIFHIKDEKTGKVLPFRNDYRGIPFFLIEIPVGIYTVIELLHEIESRCNEAISCMTSNKNIRFVITYNKNTEIINICLKDQDRSNHENYNKHDHWVFHWRFWSHWSIPEDRTLYRMLGFARPYLKTADGADYYGKCYDNVWKLGLCDDRNLVCDIKNKCEPSTRVPRPYCRINLFPETYIYLVVNGLNFNNDDIYDTNPNITLNNILAKVQVVPFSDQCFYQSTINIDNCNRNNMADGFICGPYLYNTAITTDKVYLESPLRTLDKLEISWIDEFGELVDFGHMEHSLTFRVVQYIDYLVDSNFDTTRGV